MHIQLLRHHSVGGRVARAAVGLTIVATLWMSGPQGTANANAAVDDGCRTGDSSARVKAGYNGVDPNSMSASEAIRLQQQFKERLARPGVLARMAARHVHRGHVRGLIKIRTYVHVITAEDGTGAVRRQQIRRQMQVINAGFAGRTAERAARSPFRFVIAGIDVTANDEWYDWQLTDEGTETESVVEAKQTLHRGGLRNLNIYIAGLSSGLLGYANFPGTVPLKLDGLVILNESLPGGAAAPYNKGDTATHEIGHWLNLAHTFENGCTPPGDFVGDTPYQADGENIFFCGDWPGDGSTTTPDDTCPQPGKDPVHNFMSYGDDPCLNQFTRGQVKRAVRSWFAYRAGR